ncbi:MAG: hypothetical protein ACR2MM_05290 [Flavobacteriaceae bacterium]
MIIFKTLTLFFSSTKLAIAFYMALTLLVGVMLNSCQWGPKETELTIPTKISVKDLDKSGLYFDLHQVEVLEILPTENYVYLYVSEGDRNFWIATRNSNIHVDSTYYYREALLKTNFESKQHKRVFDSIYLVTKLVNARHSKEETSSLK